MNNQDNLKIMIVHVVMLTIIRHNPSLRTLDELKELITVEINNFMEQRKLMQSAVAVTNFIQSSEFTIDENKILTAGCNHRSIDSVNTQDVEL